MGETLQENPYQYGTPEYDAYMRAQPRGAYLTARTIPAASASLVLPSGGEGVSSYVPGAATGFYGALGQIIPKVLNWGYGTNLPSAPGAEESSKLFDKSQANAEELFGIKGLAQNPEEEGVVRAIMNTPLLPVPEGILTGLDKLPALARIPAKVASFSSGVVPVSAVPSIGKVAGVLNTLPGMAQAAEGPPDLVDYINKNQPDLIDYINKNAQTGQGGPGSTTPFATTSPTDPTNQDQTSGLATAPTFHKEGETGFSWWHAILTSLGVGAIAWSALRRGGPILNKIIEGFPDTAEQTRVANAQIDAIDSNRNTYTPTTGPGQGAAQAYPDVPLPGGADQFTTRATQYWQNPNAVVNKIIEATIPNSSLAQRLRATWGTYNNEANMVDILNAQKRTGVNFMTGNQGVRVNDIYSDHDLLTPQQQQVLHEGMYAADELDTRQIKYNQATRAAPVGQPILWDDPAFRDNFTNTNNATLEQMRDAMINDPKTAAVANEMWATNRQIPQDAFTAGRITQQALNDALKYRPHYMPTVLEDGTVMPPFGERPIGEARKGWVEPPIPAMDAFVNHYDQAYKMVAQNATLRTFVRNGLSYQAADPVNNPQMFTELAPHAGAGEKTVTMYDGTGPRTFRVNSDVLHQALKGNSKQAVSAIDGVNTMRRIFQSGITGGMAIISGKWFAPLQAIRMSEQIAAGRTPGTYGGLIDKALQQRGMTGLRAAIDPTTLPMVGVEAMKGMGSAFAKNFGDMLSANNPLSQYIRGIKGDVWTDALSTRMQNRYNMSNLGQFRANAGAGGGYGSAEARTYQMARPGTTTPYINPAADIYSNTFREPHIPILNIPLPGMKGVFAQTLNIKSLLGDLNQSVHDAGNAYYFRLNRDNPNFTPLQMGYEARRAVGDTTQRGAGRAAQVAAQSLPYANVVLQDMTRLMTNFRDNPLATLAGEILTPGKLAIASVLTAMLGGKAHVDHLENQLSTQQREGDATIYHDPTNPLNNTQISLPQRWRPYYPLLLEAIATGVGAFQHTDPNDPMHARVVHALADFFNHHIQTSTTTSVMHGISNMLDLSLPGYVTTPLSMFGGEINPLLGTIAQNFKEGNPWFSNLLRTYNDPAKIPGQLGSSTIVSNDDGKWMSRFLSSLFGMAGASLAQTYGLGSERMHEGADMWSAFTGSIGDAMQNFRDRNPYGNIVWGNTAALSTFNPMEEKISNELHQIKLVGGPTDTTSFGETSSNSPNRVAATGQTKAPQDPDMARLYALVDNFNQTLQPYEKAYNDTKVAWDQVNSQGLSAQDKRKVTNAIALQRNQAAEAIDAQIQRMNEYVSGMFGGRHIDVGSHIDWQGTMDQFHR